MKEELEKALEIIRKFVNEFDEEGEVSYNTRDEAEIFLTNQQEQAKEMENEQELKEWIETWSLGYNSGWDNCMKKFKQQEQ